jgi:UTP--glucose-1-phosphate uridylyltransferase
MQLSKAVIPAAGFGTRMLPAAKAVAKELLPIVDRPTIQYVIEELAGAGISDVALITSRDKPALTAHFAPSPALEARLAGSGKQSLLDSVSALIARIRITPVYQEEQRGLGHAVLQARRAMGQSAFLALLGDTIFSGEPTPAQQLAQAYQKLGTALIGLEEVPAEKVSRYGIVGGAEIAPGVIRIDSLIEKPSIDQAPSRLAIAARYVLTPTIFACLHETPPG